MAKKKASAKMTVEESFIEILQNTFGDNLISAMLYGSYVRGTFIRGVSDINILIILEKPLTEQIEKFGMKKSFRFIRRNNITPLILTRSEFTNSADVFPMEYFDIKDHNRVLFGEDETKSLSLTMKNLRHQIEDRLRGEVASLRQSIIASSGRKRALKRYLRRAGSLNAAFRGLLRLKKTAVASLSSGDVLQKVREVFNIDIDPISKLDKMRSGEKIDPKPLARDLLVMLEELIKIVDKMSF